MLTQNDPPVVSYGAVLVFSGVSSLPVSVTSSFLVVVPAAVGGDLAAHSVVAGAGDDGSADAAVDSLEARSPSMASAWSAMPA